MRKPWRGRKCRKCRQMCATTIFWKCAGYPSPQKYRYHLEQQRRQTERAEQKGEQVEIHHKPPRYVPTSVLSEGAEV